MKIFISRSDNSDNGDPYAVEDWTDGDGLILDTFATTTEIRKRIDSMKEEASAWEAALVEYLKS